LQEPTAGSTGCARSKGLPKTSKTRETLEEICGKLSISSAMEEKENLSTMFISENKF